MARELGAEVLAVDISPRMVELTRGRGVDARVGDVQALPFADGEFDLVVAAWVLFHPADLDRALAEIARVLVAGGRLVAATNSERHLEQVWSLVDAPISYSFSAENGAEALRRHFQRVSCRCVEGWITFSDTEAVRAYVAASILNSHLAELVPDMQEPLRARRSNAIFVAVKAN